MLVLRQIEDEEEEEILQTKGLSNQTDKVTPDTESRIHSRGGGQLLQEIDRSFNSKDLELISTRAVAGGISVVGALTASVASIALERLEHQEKICD
jgi:hypothetical protein